MSVNEFGQPLGAAVPDWCPREPAGPVTLVGRTARLEPLTPDHAPGLFAALVEESPPSVWTYLASGPFDDLSTFTEYVEGLVSNPALVPLVVLVEGRPLGHECLMRMDPAVGSIEVGNVALGTGLQRTTAATETAYLLARHVFEELGYRRYEWKCDSLNAPSRRAALRFGFRYEGTFRNAVVYKGRSRDTAWFAMTDGDWVGLRPAYDAWLDPANFDADGRQRRRLDLSALAPDVGTLVPDAGTSGTLS